MAYYVRTRHRLNINGSSEISNWSTPLKVDLPEDSGTLLPTPPRVFYGGALGVVGDNLFCLGGSNGSSATNTIYKYSFINKNGTLMTPTLPSVMYHSVGVTVGTDVYSVGGWYGSGTSNALYKYNTISNSVSQLANMPGAAYFQTGSYYNGYIYTFGGIYNSGSYYLRNQTFVYDIANNSWSYINNFPVGATYGTSVAVGQYVYFPGGKFNTNSNDGGSHSNRFLRFNYVTGVVDELATMPVANSYQLCGHNDGFIYTAGGGYGSAHDNMYRYNILTNTGETLTKKFPTPAYFGSGNQTIQYNGKIYSLSFYNGSAYQSNFYSGSNL